MNTAPLATPAAAPATAPQGPGAPWWRHGHVWMIIAGPALVVLASIVTVVIAVGRPDPVVAEDYYRRGIEINKTLPAGGQPGAKALMPALQARNHAASPAPGAAPQALQPADR